MLKIIIPHFVIPFTICRRNRLVNRQLTERLPPVPRVCSAASSLEQRAAPWRRHYMIVVTAVTVIPAGLKCFRVIFASPARLRSSSSKYAVVYRDKNTENSKLLLFFENSIKKFCFFFLFRSTFDASRIYVDSLDT